MIAASQHIQFTYKMLEISAKINNGSHKNKFVDIIRPVILTYSWIKFIETTLFISYVVVWLGTYSIKVLNPKDQVLQNGRLEIKIQ